MKHSLCCCTSLHGDECYCNQSCDLSQSSWKKLAMDSKMSMTCVAEAKLPFWLASFWCASCLGVGRYPLLKRLWYETSCSKSMTCHPIGL